MADRYSQLLARAKALQIVEKARLPPSRPEIEFETTEQRHKSVTPDSRLDDFDEWLVAQGLGHHTARLKMFGIETAKDLRDVSLVSDAEIRFEVGMTQREVDHLRASVVREGAHLDAIWLAQRSRCSPTAVSFPIISPKLDSSPKPSSLPVIPDVGIGIVDEMSTVTTLVDPTNSETPRTAGTAGYHFSPTRDWLSPEARTAAERMAEISKRASSMKVAREARLLAEAKVMAGRAADVAKRALVAKTAREERLGVEARAFAERTAQLNKRATQPRSAQAHSAAGDCRQALTTVQAGRPEENAAWGTLSVEEQWSLLSCEEQQSALSAEEQSARPQTTKSATHLARGEALVFAQAAAYAKSSIQAQAHAESEVAAFAQAALYARAAMEARAQAEAEVIKLETINAAKALHAPHESFDRALQTTKAGVHVKTHRNEICEKATEISRSEGVLRQRAPELRCRRTPGPQLSDLNRKLESLLHLRASWGCAGRDLVLTS